MFAKKSQSAEAPLPVIEDLDLAPMSGGDSGPEGTISSGDQGTVNQVIGAIGGLIG
jgi:hypothetical protein